MNMPEFICREAVFEQYDFDSLLSPIAEEGQLMGCDGVPIAYICYRPENAHTAVVISSGRLESYLKYKEFCFELVKNGYAVYAMDHCGQGLSGRLLSDSQVGHVDSYRRYIKDFQQFVDSVVLPDGHKRRVLIGHSMGSCIAALSLYHHPGQFERAVLLSPMFGIHTRPYPDWLARILIKLTHKLSNFRCHWFGGEPTYFMGKHAYKPVPFEDNELTHSPIRYAWFRELYKRLPQLQLGGPSPQWIDASMRAMAFLQQNAEEIDLPLLLLESGEDKIVSSAPTHRFAEKAPDATVVTISGAKHELLFESDSYREPALKALFNFIKPASGAAHD